MTFTQHHFHMIFQSSYKFITEGPAQICKNQLLQLQFWNFFLKTFSMIVMKFWVSSWGIISTLAWCSKLFTYRFSAAAAHFPSPYHQHHLFQRRQAPDHQLSALMTPLLWRPPPAAVYILSHHQCHSTTLWLHWISCQPPVPGRYAWHVGATRNARQ